MKHPSTPQAPAPQTILLLDDDPTHAQAIHDALAKAADAPFRIKWVRSCSAALDWLRCVENHCSTAETPDKPASVEAILLDMSMPDGSGFDAFTRLFAVAPYVPILLLCLSKDEGLAKSAVRRGAQEYLFKNRLDPYFLPKTVRNMIDRAAIAEALFHVQERARVTLNSIGDAVVSTDVRGQISYLNPVAERLTGWCSTDAVGRPAEEVLRIVDAARAAVRNPLALAMRTNQAARLIRHSILIRRDGVEIAIEDSAAPIHDRRGAVTGAVMVFHEVTVPKALSIPLFDQIRHLDTATAAAP